MGSVERNNIPIVFGFSGIAWWRYGDTTSGKAETDGLGPPKSKAKSKVAAQQDVREHEEDEDNIRQDIEPPVLSDHPPLPRGSSVQIATKPSGDDVTQGHPVPSEAEPRIPIPPAVPIATKPTFVAKQHVLQACATKPTRTEEIEAEIQRLAVLLVAEKQKPGESVPDVFSHYELIPPDGEGTGSPNELYQLPEIRVVYQPAPPQLTKAHYPSRNVAVENAAYHKALTAPYRGELAGGSKSKTFVKKQAGSGNTGHPISPLAFYGAAGTPPSARPLTRQIPGHHPSVRVVPDQGSLTRADQRARMSRPAPTKSGVNVAAPTAGQIAIPPRFNQQRYLRDNTVGPSYEVFCGDKDIDADMTMQ